jgi:hypothetical protein
MRSSRRQLAPATRPRTGAPPWEGPRRGPRRPALVAALLSCAFGSAHPARGQGVDAATELRSILERAGGYAHEYETAFSHIAATEEYRQESWEYGLPEPTRRRTRAEMVFVELPGALPWTTLRDVYEVDGQKVHDRAQRLERLFSEAPATAPERAAAIVTQSAAYNLGPVNRTVNVPILALLFLLPDNQPRFLFEIKRRRSVDGLAAVEVAFAERARPTFVHDSLGQETPTRGIYLLDPSSGSVLRTRVDYLTPQSRAMMMRVETEYRRDPRLGMFVPSLMREDFHFFRLRTTARYSDYRRFQVTTEEVYRPVLFDQGGTR